MRARLAPLLMGLFFALLTQNAEAGCAQYAYFSGGGSDAFGGISIEFDRSGGGGSWWSCGWFEEVGGAGYAYAQYGAWVYVNAPNGTGTSNSNSGIWGTAAYATLPIAGTGPGNAEVTIGAVEYLVDGEHAPDRFDYGPWSFSHYASGPSGGGEGPSLTLSASNRTPVVNSGPVQVTAEYSGGDPGPVSFSNNCTQATNMMCTFNPTTVGQHIVTGTLNGLQAQVPINVLAAQDSGTLRLLLDGDGLDPANAFQTDDWSRFDPGAYFEGGFYNLEQSPQSVTLVAAFVTDSGRIVPPPEGVTHARFDLSQVTGYAGFAMNRGWGDNRDLMLDYGLGDADLRARNTTVPFNSSTYQARVTLFVHDYGGSTKVKATIPDSILASDLRSLPASVPGEGDSESSAFGNTHPGDGLSDYEEWRGFFILGTFRRTSPVMKDVFIVHIDPVLGGYSQGYAAQLGITFNEVSSSEVQGAASWINEWNFNYGAGTERTPGHNGLKALRIEEGFGGPSCMPSNCNLGEWQAEDLVNTHQSINNTLWIRVYSRTLRWSSPPNDSQTLEDLPDNTMIPHVIGHEIGHALNLNHVPSVPTGCELPPDQRTVMVSGRFKKNDQSGDYSCAWQPAYIPFSYLDFELRDFIVKPW